jgi:hypothetical protein
LSRSGPTIIDCLWDGPFAPIPARERLIERAGLQRQTGLGDNQKWRTHAPWNHRQGKSAEM